MPMPGDAFMMDRLETFDSLRDRIMARYDDLSPHLQRLARIALEDPNSVALETVVAIAARVEVQPSTLIRFAKEFGYSGFSQMQKIFKLRLIEGGPVYRERVYEKHSETDSAHSDDPITLLEQCAGASITSLQNLISTVRHDDLIRAVEILDRSTHVYVAGLRRSRPIATYLAYSLVRLERRCSILDFGGGMAAQQVANMRRGDVLVAIAFAEYSAPVVDVVREAHLRGVTVLAITDSSSSPLARTSTVVFYVDDETTEQFRPIAGAIGLVHTLIISLGAQSESRSRRQFSEVAEDSPAPKIFGGQPAT
jgi:DNA-binding MurR/RpiR family transcriptional regulator